MKKAPLIGLKLIWMTIFIWLFDGRQFRLIECITRGSHYLRHHQHTTGSMLWRTRDDSTINMTEIFVHPRDDTRISCELANSSHVAKDNVRWFHNDLEVDSAHRYVMDSTSGSMTIVNSRYEDGGLWYCQDRDTGFRGNLVHVIVLEEPKAPYLLIDGRQLDPGNLFVPIRENADLSLECVVEGGNPKPRLSWSLIPSSTNVDVSTGIISLPSLQVFNESLSVEPLAVHLSRIEAKLPKVLRAHHNSTVVCLVHHATLPSPANTSILLDVQYTPSFGISRMPGFGFPITEGFAVSLKCDVDSNPPANPIWQRDNNSPPTEQSSDGYLNFTAIKTDDSGWYKCITRYQLAEYSSIGYFLNVREIRSQTSEDETPEEVVEEGSALEVTLGGEVQLECPVGAASCWGRVKNPGRDLDPIGPGPKLVLHNVIYQEAGEYKCFVEQSSKGEKWKSRSVQVNVIGSPVIYPMNKTITAVINQRVTFSLEFCANPPVTKVFWIRGMVALSPGTTTSGLIAHDLIDSSTMHCRKAELTITTVSKTDSGEYMLVIASERGLTGATITLNVTVSTVLPDAVVKGTHNGCLQPIPKYIVIFLSLFCSVEYLFLFGDLNSGRSIRSTILVIIFRR